jgi:hypothetical protein
MRKKNSFHSSIVKVLLIFTIAFLFTSCKSTKPLATTQTQEIKKDRVISLQVKSLKAIDLEEDLTLADEVVLTYSLTAVDENNKILEVANGSWGVESMKKGQIVLGDKFQPLLLNIPAKGKVISSVILMEIDDYQKAQNIVNKINTIGGLGKIPAMFVSLGEYETPLAVVFASLQAAGIGLKAVDNYDKDDLLGQKKYDVYTSTLPQTPKTYPVNLVFKGEHLKNTFHYELSYELTIKEL